MIKNFKMRIACDPRGKISTGKKSEKGFPQSLDYFYINEFPELIEMYGDKPAELFLYMPSDNIMDFFDCEFNTYGSNAAKKRSCDGEVCIHRIDEKIGDTEYVAGEQTGCVCEKLSPTDKNRCKYVAYLRAWIVSPTSGKVDNHLCYLLETHSQNSGDAIYSELQKIQFLNKGFLRGVKFSLTVKMIGGKTDAKQKFPIWALRGVGSVSQIQEKTRLMLER